MKTVSYGFLCEMRRTDRIGRAEEGRFVARASLRCFNWPRAHGKFEKEMEEVSDAACGS